MNPWVDPRIKEVRPEQVRAYMIAHGWEPKPFPRPGVWLFEGPPDDDGRPIPLMIPSDSAFIDYLQRLYELITTLAILEDRLAVDVLNDMLAPANGQPSTDGANQGRDAAVRA